MKVVSTCGRKVSIHALNEECDTGGAVIAYLIILFQSTHSMKSATRMGNSAGVQSRFQSTHSMKSATELLQALKAIQNVSIHALNEECDKIVGSGRMILSLFQSTHSMKSATDCGQWQDDIILVSIHALNEECDKQSD